MKGPHPATPHQLPDGVELSLCELREMASRQQQQIDQHQQQLVAKEQRLKYLKQQENRHQAMSSETERLRRLRERVEAQELKLRKLRALRGQSEQQRVNNTALSADLEQMRALFNEKEKELSLAVARVEEMTRQLEEVRKGRQNHHQNAASHTQRQLEKLRRQLMYRNQLHEQQNSQLASQEQTLAQRRDQMAKIDQRIAELQQRLHRKRVHNQQLAEQLQNASAAKRHVRQQQGNTLPPGGPTAANLQHSQFVPSKGDPKYQTLPYNTKFHQVKEAVEKQDELALNATAATGVPAGAMPAPASGQPAAVRAAATRAPPLGGTSNQQVPPHHQQQQQQLQQLQLQPSTRPSGLPRPTTAGSGPTTSAPAGSAASRVPAPPAGAAAPSSPDPAAINGDRPLLPPKPGASAPLGVTNNPETRGPLDARPGPPDAKPTYHDKISQNNARLAYPDVRPAAPGAGELRPPDARSHAPEGRAGGQETRLSVQDAVRPVLGDVTQVSARNANGHLHSAQQYRYASRSQIASAYTSQPRPEAPASNSELSVSSAPQQARADLPAQQRPDLTFAPQQRSDAPASTGQTQLDAVAVSHQQTQREGTVAAEQNSGQSQPAKLQPDAPGQQASELNSNSGFTHPVEDAASSADRGVRVSINSRIEMPPSYLLPQQQRGDASAAGAPGGTDVNDNCDEVDRAAPPGSVGQQGQARLQQLIETEKLLNLDANSNPQLTAKGDGGSTESGGSDSSDSPTGPAVRRRKASNLKTPGSAAKSQRVSFDPLALLLDASLEGELDLVKKTAGEVRDPSASNDEGITALHNAICAGHFEIVQFLVEFGCDVNSQDSDGWTPLHCAASCNNLPMVRFLVEHGACIFATTLSDHETAAEKCEEEEEGYQGCSQYLYSIQEKLGIMNGGRVYAVFTYAAQNSDELPLVDGQQLVVLRKGDEVEREWWWASTGDDTPPREGYVPRNLLGLYPRVKPLSQAEDEA